jgi:hypothetical protein
MVPKTPIEIASDFLRDTAKIIFGSTVIGFFLSTELSVSILIGGILSTSIFLYLSIMLFKFEKREI